MVETDWREVLTLSSDRKVIGGSYDAFTSAIGRGADFRIGTEFRHNEHIDTTSSDHSLMRETMHFPVTYLVDNRWAAAACTLRQPVADLNGFGARPSMSLFLYNQNGDQGVARLHLDGGEMGTGFGPSIATNHPDMPKYHQADNYDVGTNAPATNFVYDFDVFRFFVREGWRELLHHDEKGKVIEGSVDALIDAFSRGCDVKVGVSGLCDDLVPAGEKTIENIIFSSTIANYSYLDQKLFYVATTPLVRIRPSVPLKYGSRNWDVGWLIVRTDGVVKTLIYDPYTLKTSRGNLRCGVRWFAR
jgi:hypothetical protein